MSAPPDPKRGWGSCALTPDLRTTLNQEDHVSMAAHGARRLLPMAENAGAVLGIELLVAAQGCDFHVPLRSSRRLEQVRSTLRATVPALDGDRYIAPDLATAAALVASGQIAEAAATDLPLVLKWRLRPWRLRGHHKKAKKQPEVRQMTRASSDFRFSPITRRSALALAAAAGAGWTRPAHADAKTVYLLTWGGTIQAMLERDGWAKKFNAATGYNVVLVPKATGTEIMATAIAQKAKPQVDVVQSDLLPWLTGVDQDLYEPIDQASVPNIAELYAPSLVHDRKGQTIQGVEPYGDPLDRALWRRIRIDLQHGCVRQERVEAADAVDRP